MSSTSTTSEIIQKPVNPAPDVESMDSIVVETPTTLALDVNNTACDKSTENNAVSSIETSTTSEIIDKKSANPTPDVESMETTDVDPSTTVVLEVKNTTCEPSAVPSIENAPKITMKNDANSLPAVSETLTESVACDNTAAVCETAPLLDTAPANNSNALQLLHSTYSDSEDSEDSSDDDDEDDTSSDDDDSSSTDTSSDESVISVPDDSDNNVNGNMTSSDDSDTDDGGIPKKFRDSPKRKTPDLMNMFRVPGELTIDDLPPIEDLHITVPEEECKLIGKTSGIVDKLVLVDALPNLVPLDLDTVLFLEKGQRTLGKVFDVMGPINSPIYCVRFNSHQDILDKKISIGVDVYLAPNAAYTSYVVVPEIMKQKGSDSSWLHDVETPVVHIDYSDDEEEREALKRSKQNRSNKNKPAQQASNQGNAQPNQGYRSGYHRQNPNFRPETPPNQFNRGGGGRNSFPNNRHYPQPPQMCPMPNNSQYPQYGPPQPPPQAPYGAQYGYPYMPPGQFYSNPFTYNPQIRYPPRENLFSMPPPPPPPPSANEYPPQQAQASYQQPPFNYGPYQQNPSQPRFRNNQRNQRR